MSNDPFQLHGSDIHDREIDVSYARFQVDEIVTDEQARSQPYTRMISMRRIRWAMVLIFSVIGVLFARTAFLQLASGTVYRASAEINRIRSQILPAPRGLFYDRNGELLVRNVPNFRVLIVPADLPEDGNERERVLDHVGGLLGKSPSELAEQIENASNSLYEPILITEQVDYNTAIRLRIDAGGLPGVSIETGARRDYLMGTAFSHLLGYTGKLTKEELDQDQEREYRLNDVIGKSGLEVQYEKLLRGKNGVKRIEVNALGKEQKVLAKENPQPGQHLLLGIDRGLQQVLTDALMEFLNQQIGVGGAAVAINPQNGEILALTSVPSYDHNEFAEGISSERYAELIKNPHLPLFMRAVSGAYPSGSIFKPIVAAAALQEGVIRPGQTINSTGGIRVGNSFFPDWKPGGHGLTDARKSIAWSINSFYYYIGGGYQDFKGLGVERIAAYAKMFGLSEKVGIDFPGEVTGLIPTPAWKQETLGEKWYLGNTYHLSIGQGFLSMTPLQAATYTATIANGGTFYRPHLLHAVKDANGNVEDVQPEVIRTGFIKGAYIEEVRAGMRDAVVYGSAQALQSLPILAAAKTGTAQFGDDEKTHSWFTAFAPYDHPTIAVAVLVEKGGGGGAVALPVAKKGLEYYFRDLQQKNPGVDN
ncbi:MAG: penicillin-binding protein 2 [Patescibacteria group bacterium]